MLKARSYLCWLTGVSMVLVLLAFTLAGWAAKPESPSRKPGNAPAADSGDGVITPPPLIPDPADPSKPEKPAKPTKGDDIDKPEKPGAIEEPKKPAAKPLPGASEEKENHPDGSLKFRVRLDSKGERHGIYTAYFPGPKKIVQEKCTYQHGQLHGVRELYDQKKNLIAEETWFNGKLVFPKSSKMIEAARSRLTAEAVAAISKMKPPTNPHAPSRELLARTMAKLNLYRYLCDVPADVVLDDEKINYAQYAAELVEKLGHLTHTPEHPAGMSDQSYELGRQGCANTNLHMGSDVVASIDGYMDDGDASNIDRIGHRRWAINPTMKVTGLGESGKFSAMWSTDRSREAVPDYEFVAFPPRGYCPVNLFGPNHPWHISFNTSKYDVGDKARMEIYPVDAKLKRAAHPMKLNFEHIDRGGFAIPNAIIARPDGFKCQPGTTFEVVIKDVECDGKPADVSYFVAFY